MRVAFATYPTAFEQPGGGEAVLLALREHLLQRGVDVDLFDPWQGSLSSYDVLHYFSSIGSDLFPYYRRYLPLVVTPCFWPALPASVRIARNLSRGSKGVLRRHVSSPFEHVDVLTPHTRLEATLLMQNYHARRDQLAVIPHGRAEEFASGSRTAFAQQHGLRPYVLCVGRIEPIKNQLRLVRALREVEFDLVLIGDAAVGAEAYYASCRAAAGPRTTFLPQMPRDSTELVDAIAGAACVVVPSVYEIWSLVAHEAGASGVPIAASSGGSMRELLSPWAFFFDPADERELRDAVRSAARREVSLRQQQDFLNRPTWDDVARMVQRLYERVLAARRAT